MNGARRRVPPVVHVQPVAVCPGTRDKPQPEFWAVPVARAVYLVAGHHRSARAQARTAVLSVSSNAALGGVAAAWWLGLHPKEPRKHLVFTGSHGAHTRSSATAVVRHRRLTDADVTTHADLRVTAAPLTALDASAELGITVPDSAVLSGTVKLADL